MPIFEYRCEACDHRFERITSHSAETEPCPACGQPARRVVSAPAASVAAKGEVSGGCAPRGGFT